MDENYDDHPSSSIKHINIIDPMRIREASRRLDEYLRDAESGRQKAFVSTCPVNEITKESSFCSLYEYGVSVFEQIHHVLSRHGYCSSALITEKEIAGIRFSTTMQHTDIIVHIFCEYRLCVYRIEMNLCQWETIEQEKRISQMTQEINTNLRFGHIAVDPLRKEAKLIYSSCYHGFFSASVFDRYLGCLLLTSQKYCEEMRKLHCA